VYLCRAAPTTYGVTVNKTATIQEVLDVAAPLAGLSTDEMLLAGLVTPERFMRGGCSVVLKTNLSEQVQSLLDSAQETQETRTCSRI
jgi:hypothetical protein